MAPGDSVAAPDVHFGCVLDVVNNPLILVLMETPVKSRRNASYWRIYNAAIGVSFMKIIIFYAFYHRVK